MNEGFIKGDDPRPHSMNAAESGHISITTPVVSVSQAAKVKQEIIF